MFSTERYLLENENVVFGFVQGNRKIFLAKCCYGENGNVSFFSLCRIEFLVLGVTP